jgi:hypothetical protein
MRRLFVPTFGPSDWRRLLAKPATQWREKKSAYETAVAWEAARRTERGLPPAIAAVLDTSEHFRGASLLLALPEHQGALEGGGHKSQTDLWALISAPIGVVSVAVEAKASEPFDKKVSDWLVGAKAESGKPARLKQLRGILGIGEEEALSCRYQLLHRSVIAILEAKRFQLRTALLLIHAFGDNDASLRDYQLWAGLLGVEASADSVQPARECDGVALWIGWVSQSPASDATVRSAV